MASDNDVAYASAGSLLDLYRTRELSPVEATRILLDRLDALQPEINAFCIVDRDGAVAAARESERRWQIRCLRALRVSSSGHVPASQELRCRRSADQKR